jgi:hypothetical protein
MSNVTRADFDSLQRNIVTVASVISAFISLIFALVGGCNLRNNGRVLKAVKETAEVAANALAETKRISSARSETRPASPVAQQPGVFPAPDQQ